MTCFNSNHCTDRDRYVPHSSKHLFKINGNLNSKDNANIGKTFLTFLKEKKIKNKV